MLDADADTPQSPFPPRCPKPPHDLVEAAVRSIPLIFQCDYLGELAELPFHLVRSELLNAGHLDTVAYWAIHRAIERGLLASRAQTLTDSGGDSYQLLILNPTVDLWRFWRGEPTTLDRAKSATAEPEGAAQDATDHQDDDGKSRNKPAKGATKDSRDTLIERMDRADRLAYLAFLYAESTKGKRLEDRDAYVLLSDEGIPDNAGAKGDLKGYKLPCFDSWSRYLRTARELLGEQKYTCRNGRPHGRSITKGDRIEPQKPAGK